MTVAVSCSETPLPTIWEVPDELWERIEPILAARYPLECSGIGCSGSSATTRGVHRWFQAFVGDCVLEEVWAALLVECEALGKLDWTWQAVDGMMGKAPPGRF